MRYIFVSNFKNYIEDLIKQKQALGYTYGNDQWYLKDFDQFCISQFTKETILTKEICMKWSELRTNENACGLKRRIVPIRELAKYMNSVGVLAYMIPNNLVRKTPRYIPHIFTQNELTAFFTATDKLNFNKISPIRHLVVPVIFRVIYCCALRPSEALKLKVADIDLKYGKLNIKESKGHKDRIVVLSEELLTLCRKYHAIVSCSLPQSEYFFPNHRGNKYSPSNLYRLFCLCWKIADIQDFYGPVPRIYDFRHSAATNCLYRWMKEGRDLNACLPYLSAHLGHSSFSETAYYIHMIPEFFPQMAKMDMVRFANLIPEVEA